MLSDMEQPLELPQHPLLAQFALAYEATGSWAEIVDHDWRWVYMTTDMRASMDANVALAPVAIGAHFFGSEASAARARWRRGPRDPEDMRMGLRSVLAWILADTGAGPEVLREQVDPALAGEIGEAQPPGDVPHVVWGTRPGSGISQLPTVVQMVAQRLRDADGRVAGTLFTYKPQARMAVLATLSAAGDLDHFDRMQRVGRAGRRAVAILFADLEASSALARRLSTAGYFALGSRLVRAADELIVEAGGLVGRHAGDGVTAFFLTETSGSDSAAARACIDVARRLQPAADAIAARIGFAPGEIVLRSGLHWGDRAYVGQILSLGRAEVTALGEEVNEAARIESCASGGRILASKALLERLDEEDARRLGLTPQALGYTLLGDLPTATDKARRDAPAIAVCQI